MPGSYIRQLSVIPNPHQRIQQSSLECYSGASACHPGQSIQIPNWAGIIPGIHEESSCYKFINAVL